MKTKQAYILIILASLFPWLMLMFTIGFMALFYGGSSIYQMPLATMLFSIVWLGVSPIFIFCALLFTRKVSANNFAQASAAVTTIVDGDLLRTSATHCSKSACSNKEAANG
jgi:hypothetical protein